MPGISPQMREFAQRVFADEETQKPCQDCGGVHARVCPRIQSSRIVINEKGVITEREVAYWAPGVWESYGIIWPEDVYDDDDASSGE
jgi:hypothetical protein